MEWNVFGKQGQKKKKKTTDTNKVTYAHLLYVLQLIYNNSKGLFCISHPTKDKDLLSYELFPGTNFISLKGNKMLFIYSVNLKKC